LAEAGGGWGIQPQQQTRSCTARVPQAKFRDAEPLYKQAWELRSQVRAI
jgi:hypothetical protein